MEKVRQLSYVYYRIMRLKHLTICLLLLLASSLSADARLDEIMQKMQKKYENLTTLKAEFTQSYQSKRFSDRMSESGVVYFSKGGLMKWEYQKPESKMFLCDGRYYFYYVPEDKQVMKASADKTDQHSPMLFLAGRGNFLKDFRPEWADPRAGSHLVKLTPTAPQPDFHHLIVDVDPVNGYILRLLVVDAYDNRTEYTFQQFSENPELPSNFFAFQPPPGTDIIYQRGESD